MSGYLVPAGRGEAELVEKRSRFIGQVCPAQSEEEARAFLESVKKQHYDARHNCWCYLLRGGAVRYSDDGEPQGTAGQPMLGVFQKEQVENVCCVVTRYFGGILLGAGGLVRAYSRCAKEALDAAGVSEVTAWARLALACPYPLLERLRAGLAGQGAVEETAEYGEAVRLTLLLPEQDAEAFSLWLTELTAGGALPHRLGTVLRAAPRANQNKL